MIAITGATGTNGKLLLERLNADGVAVRALVRRPQSIATSRKVTAAELDFTRPETFEPALQGVTRALLLTVSNPQQSEWEAKFIAAAERAGVQHIIYFSALGSDSPRPITIGRWHAATEAALRSSKLNWTVVRPTAFMQNFFWSAASIADGTYAAATGSGAVSFIDARDITDILVATLTGSGHEKKAYNLTGPEALDGNGIARLFTAELGRPVRFVDLTRVQFEAAAKANNGMPAWYATALGELYDGMRAGYMDSVTSDVTEVTRRPARTFADFVRDYHKIFSGTPAGATR
ncbi:MAG TPA: SDR family oxidoreductase [Candidatus Baltobacteraceae bacterium]|jgi:uncharacterized protein YbjT (DUF2867 family)|nr:SDR family oxidoreductase [Candidatus Baltobacteraceae bacterium]